MTTINSLWESTRCPKCGGSGEEQAGLGIGPPVGAPCSNCHGSGFRSERHKALWEAVTKGLTDTGEYENCMELNSLTITLKSESEQALALWEMVPMGWRIFKDYEGFVQVAAAPVRVVIAVFYAHATRLRDALLVAILKALEGEKW